MRYYFMFMVFVTLGLLFCNDIHQPADILVMIAFILMGIGYMLAEALSNIRKLLENK